MRLILASALILAAAPATCAFAADGQPASPSGAPAAAAEHGSSMVGDPASKNEMKSHEDNASVQREQVNPHKTAH